MSDSLSVAIVTASSTSLVAIVALIQNNKRMDDFARRLERIDNRLDHIESTLAGYVLDMARIKEKLGL
ncbi:MAG: hypothetical protein WAM39_31540 [Bryobacteraceae bacterium]